MIDSDAKVNAARADSSEAWASALGVILVLSMFASLALIAAGGWPWFQKFLESSAASWTQAIGSIAAILAAVYLGQAQRASDRALERTRLNQDERKKVLVIDALLEALESGVNLAKKQFTDYPGMPVYPYYAERVRTASHALSKIDLFACPAQIIQSLLHLFPTPCENLLETLRRFGESFDKFDDDHSATG